MPDPECGLCHHGKDANDVCGQLYQSSECMAHLKCMQYSAGLVQYKYNLGFGGFKIEKVLGEISRGKKLKCHLCKANKKISVAACRGASAGCAVARCTKSFHFYCAHKNSQTVTRRMEVMLQHTSSSKKKKLVEYRVFCSKRHQEVYENQKAKEDQYIRRPSEESGSDDPGSETDMPPAEMMSQSMKDLEFETDSSSDSGDNSNDSASVQRKPKKPSKKRKSPTSTSEDDFQKEKKSVKRTPSRSSTHKRKKSPRRPSTTSSDSITSLEDAKARRRSTAKKPRRRSSPGDENGSCGSDELSQSSLGKQIGTLTPLQERAQAASHAEDRDARKNLGFRGKVKKQDKSVDMSQGKGFVIAKLNPEKDCLLCFVEKAEVSPGLEHKLRKFATRMFQVPAGSLYVNKYPGFQLSGEHVVYLLKDLTMTLRVGDLEDFQRLVLHLKEEDLSKYNYIINLNADYPEDLSRTLYAKLRDSIRDNLHTASENMGSQIGWYCRVQYKEEHIRIAIIALSDPTDPSGVIRDSFRNRVEVHEWQPAENPIFSPELVTVDTRKKEFDVLKQWLSTMEGALIDPRPRDNLILGSTKDSVTVRLFNHFKAATVFQQTTACIIFLRPLDSDAVNVLEYIRKLFANILSESRDARSTVVLLFDLDVDLDLQKHVLCHLPAEVKVRVLTAFDTTDDPVSCVVITMDLEASTKTRYSLSTSVPDADPTPRALTGKNEGPSDEYDPSDAADDDVCEVTAIEMPTADVYFLPPDLRWRLVHSNSLNLIVQSINASTKVQPREPKYLGRPATTIKIKGDGNCFFRALSQQITGSERQHYHVRKRLVSYMIRHNKTFEKYFNMRNVKLYIDMKRMADDGTWATDTEIIAMATMLDTQIVIYTEVAGRYKWLPYKPLGQRSKYECKVYLVNKKYHFDLVLSVMEKRRKQAAAKDQESSMVVDDKDTSVNMEPVGSDQDS